MTDIISVGIDISSRSNQICIIDSKGKVLKNFSVKNNSVGADIIISTTIGYLNSLKLVDVQFAMESTSVYGDNLVMHLKNDSLMNKFSMDVFKINPKQIKKFKDVYPDLQKNDNIDAWTIAEFMRLGGFNTNPVYFDERFYSLQKLTRARCSTVQNLAREKNRYLNILFSKFSEMAIQPLFSNKLGSTAVSVIEDFESLDELSNTPMEQLVTYVMKQGKNHFVDPDKVARELQKAARSSYRLSKTVEDSVNQVLSITLISIKTYQEQLKQYDQAIENIMNAIPNTLTSIKGVGVSDETKWSG